jgi:hypothetical protein
MSKMNGLGSKRAVLHTRVSTDEQARSVYSLAQQLKADLYRATPGAWFHPRDRVQHRNDGSRSER